MASARKFQIDTKTFVRFWLVIIAIVLVFLFVGQAWEGILIVGIAAFLAIAIQPLAKLFEKWFSTKEKKRTTLASVSAFLAVIVALGFIVSFVAPVVVNETVHFVEQLPQTFHEGLGGWEGINNFGHNFGVDDLQGKIQEGITSFSNDFMSNVGSNLASGVGTVANIITNIILTLVITLLLLLEGHTLVEGFWKLFRSKSRRKQARAQQMRKTIASMKEVVATYVSRQLLVAILDGCVVALTVFILSLIFGFSSGLAIPMGLITMTCYMIPMFGPIIGCVIVALVLAVSNIWAALIFAIFYIVYGQVEANVIAPKLQGNALKMPAVMVLIAVVLGIKTCGILGALIAIPIAGCIKVLIDDYPKYKAIREHNYKDEKKDKNVTKIETETKH